MNHEPRRPRKLLLHKRELRKFAESAGERGLTLIPLAVYFKRGIVKVKVAIARGRKLHDKRERMKKEDVTWRSFWNGPKGTRGPISQAWNVHGWPTLYYLDHKGVIRFKDVRDEQAMERVLGELIAEAKAAR